MEEEVSNNQEWQPVSADCLNEYESSEDLYAEEQVIAKERKGIIQSTLYDFGIDVKVLDFVIGPTITSYSIKCGHNTSLRSVANILTDIQVRMSGTPVRFEQVVMGHSFSTLEIENELYKKVVPFKEMVEALPDYKEHPLAIPLGKRVDDQAIFADLDKLPHILLSGTTGSGKSIFMNSIITTLIMRNSPDSLKFVLVDPKKVEYFRYKDMPHLLCPVLKEADETKRVLEKLVEEVNKRYAEFNEIGCANIEEYNEDCVNYDWLKKKPRIVVVIDEYADIVDQDRSISASVISLAQKGKAAGIYLIIGTQRTSVNVVTGALKVNIPTHIAFMTPSMVDSLTIIGEAGAEKLIGQGDMLVQSPAISRVGLVRLQGCFAHRHEIVRVVEYLKSHYKTEYNPKFLEQEEKDNGVIKGESVINSSMDSEDRYQAVKQWVLTQEYMSISRIQRECSVGFNRAGRYFRRLQKEEVVSTESTKKGYLVLKRSLFR